MDIGSKIKKIRNENKLSQEQFAGRFHVTRQTVSNWENNRNYPDMASLKQLSDEFHMSFDVLLKDDRDLLEKIDETSKSAIGRKRIIVILIVTLCTVFIMFFWYLAEGLRRHPMGIELIQIQMSGCW